MSRRIVFALQGHGCRFLQKDIKTNLWYEVSDHAALDKVSQALREAKKSNSLRPLATCRQQETIVNTKYGHTALGMCRTLPPSSPLRF